LQEVTVDCKALILKALKDFLVLKRKGGKKSEISINDHPNG